MTVLNHSIIFLTAVIQLTADHSIPFYFYYFIKTTIFSSSTLYKIMSLNTKYSFNSINCLAVRMKQIKNFSIYKSYRTSGYDSD